MGNRNRTRQTFYLDIVFARSDDALCNLKEGDRNSAGYVQYTLATVSQTEGNQPTEVLNKNVVPFLLTISEQDDFLLVLRRAQEPVWAIAVVRIIRAI